MGIDIAEFVNPAEGLIRGEIFHSQEIYEAELKEVFGRSWLFLAHDAMIPKKGDFIQTYMGEDPVVVVRQKDGSVRAFLNQCRHRGMRICRVDRGNTKAFMCSFHGWTYDLGGELTSVPHEEAAYPQGFDKKEWGPAQVTQLTNYKGFIFGNWDPTAPSFEESMGDMLWYFDNHVDRYEGGMKPIATHKWVLEGNWKFNAEQPASDMYHGEVTHASAMQVLEINVPDVTQSAGSRLPDGMPVGTQFSSPYGHGTGFYNAPNLYGGPLEMGWKESMRDHVAARLGDLRADTAQGHMLIFPSLMLLPRGTIRVTHPRGPDKMEIWAWSFVPNAAPEEVQEEIRVSLLRTFSPGGLYEQDDAENWAEEQRIMRGFMARKNPLVYRQQLGTEQFDAFGLPGKTAPHVYAELGARGLYQHWADLMSGRSWPDLVELKKQREVEERAAAARQGSTPVEAHASAGKPSV